MRTWKIGIIAATAFAAATMSACNKNDNSSNNPPPAPVSNPSGDGNNNPQVTTETLHIAPAMNTCTTRDPQLCLVVEDANGVPQRMIYGGIQNFNFQWGHRYVIDVNRNGASYTLARMVSDQVSRIEEGFNVIADSDFVQTVRGENCQFRIGNINFTTANPQTCIALNAAITAKQGFTGHFTLTGRAESPLLLQTINVPGTANWKFINSHDFASGTPAANACGDTSFVIQTNGSFTYLDCDRQMAQGQLKPEELNQLNTLASAVTKSQLFSRNCNATPAQSVHGLYLFSDQNDLFNILRADTNGTCLRGDQGAVQQLNTFVSQLKSQYTQVHALPPGATPSPSPSASPTPGPTPGLLPTPVPTATPAVTPLP